MVSLPPSFNCQGRYNEQNRVAHTQLQVFKQSFTEQILSTCPICTDIFWKKEMSHRKNIVRDNILKQSSIFLFFIWHTTLIDAFRINKELKNNLYLISFYALSKKNLLSLNAVPDLQCNGGLEVIEWHEQGFGQTLGLEIKYVFSASLWFRWKRSINWGSAFLA